nr:hypothetical protein Iba_chr02aCG5530 [Ipomoea batatas]GMD43105.1 hypothetical protein Iba_scaffold45684CG0010 [Ipomoea batatas]
MPPNNWNVSTHPIQLHCVIRCYFLVSKILSWNFHINNMEVSQHPTLIFQLQNIFPVLQTFCQFRKCSRECCCTLRIKISFKILFVLSYKVYMLVHSIC